MKPQPLRSQQAAAAETRSSGAAALRPGGMPLLLLAEDEAERRQLAASLQAEDYAVLQAASAAEGAALAGDHSIGVYLIDLDGLDDEGLAFLQELRSWTTRPILVLSSRTEESHKVEALDAGADDYLAKPFGKPEHHARLRVALRRSALEASPDRAVLALGEVRIDLEAKTVLRGQERVRLTATEWRLLEALAKRGDRVAGSRQLLREVWGPGYGEQGHYLRIYVRQLRQKLEQEPAQPRFILTEAGIGYRLLTGAPPT